MIIYAHVLLVTSILPCVLCLPTNQESRPFKVDVSNPYEINNLRYRNAITDINLEPPKLKVQSSASPRSDNSPSYIEKTVQEVEALINANSSLPRLTRGEILAIIDNITKHDFDELRKFNKPNSRDQKSIMLVLPYTPDNIDDGKMQELYTKPPITRIVNDPSKPITMDIKSKSRQPLRKDHKNRQAATPSKHIPNIVLESEVVTSKSPTIATTKEPGIKSFPEPITTNKRRRSTTTPKPTIQEISTKISVHTNIETDVSLWRSRPSKSPQRYSNHKYPDETKHTSAKEAIRIIESPQLLSKPVGFTTNVPQEVTLQTVATAKPSKPHSFTTARPLLMGVNLPDHLKMTLDELNLEDSLAKNINSSKFKNISPSNETIRNILSSFGLQPKTTTIAPMPDLTNVADTLTPDMKQLLINFGLLGNNNHKPKAAKDSVAVPASVVEINPNSYVQFKPFPQSSPISDDMEEFLGNFGLGRNSKNTRRQKKLEIKPNQTLAKVPDVAVGMLPDSMKTVLKDLGLTERQEKKIRSENLQHPVYKPKENVEKVTNKNKHVFNPAEMPYATKEELEKLSQLMELIKQLEKLNGTITEETMKTDLKNLKDLIGSFNKEEPLTLDEQEWAPDPLNYEEGVSKNEIKRQENSSTTTESVITVGTEKIEIVTPSKTPSLAEAPNIKDLEDSFGGPTENKNQESVRQQSEPPRSGFYYLLDWNSFLDIDDQQGKRVNLRFQPKAGHPRQFIAVSVP